MTVLTAVFFIAEAGSPEFDRFVSLLGDKIRLKGWDKYRGGLDVKGTLTHSVEYCYRTACVLTHSAG
jgi:hypothetical protein